MTPTMKNTVKLAALTVGLFITFAMTSCTPGERGALTGGAIGAGTGALVTGSSGGALVGGAVGAIAGSEISKNRAERNRYYGRRR